MNLADAVMCISPLAAAYVAWAQENNEQRALGAQPEDTWGYYRRLLEGPLDVRKFRLTLRGLEEAARPHRHLMRRKIRKTYGL